MYIRKTEDEFHIEGFFKESGWEMETIEVNRKLAKEQLKCYRTHQPSIQHRIIKKRVKI